MGRNGRRRRDKNSVVVVVVVVVFFNVGFDSSAREASLSHDTADTRVVKNGNDEMLELNFDGEKRVLLLLLLVVVEGGGGGGATALVGLGALESSNEGVG